MNLTKFKYAFDNKRYHTWNYYLRNTFGEKVFKVSINAGFTCPNMEKLHSEDVRIVVKKVLETLLEILKIIL